jgi:hypothetical protein
VRGHADAAGPSAYARSCGGEVTAVPEYGEGRDAALKTEGRSYTRYVKDKVDAARGGEAEAFVTLTLRARRCQNRRH